MTTPEPTPTESGTRPPTPTPPTSEPAQQPQQPQPQAITLAIRLPPPSGRSLTVRVPLAAYAPRPAIEVVATLTQLPMYLDGVRREVLRWEAEAARARARAVVPPPPMPRAPLGTPALRRPEPTRTAVGKSRVDSSVRFETYIVAAGGSSTSASASSSALNSASTSRATSPSTSPEPETPPTPPATTLPPVSSLALPSVPSLAPKRLYPSYDTPVSCHHHHPYARPLSAVRPGPPRPVRAPTPPPNPVTAALGGLEPISALAATYVRLDLLMTEIEAGTTRHILPAGTLAALAAQRTAYLAVLRREVYAWVRRLPGAVEERRELRGLVRGLARVLAELGRGLEAGLRGVSIIEH